MWCCSTWATLVEIDKTNDVFYNQLIVDHTHEDVDSQFGVGSQHLSGEHGGHVLTPGAFYGAMSKAFPENMVWTHTVRVLGVRSTLGVF